MNSTHDTLRRLCLTAGNFDPRIVSPSQLDRFFSLISVFLLLLAAEDMVHYVHEHLCWSS